MRLDWSIGAWPLQLEGFRISFYIQGFYFVLHYYLADNTCEINEAICVSTETAMENMSLKVAEFEGFFLFAKRLIVEILAGRAGQRGAWMMTCGFVLKPLRKVCVSL